MQEPPSLLQMAIKYIQYLPYRIDRDEHPGNQPGQDQYADDDRIDITVDTPEYIHVLHLSLSSGCARGASCVAG